jgi:hypothetical protein
MFGHRFFGAAYFGPRYWGDGGSEEAPAEPEPTTKRRLVYGLGPMSKSKVHPHPKFNA